MHEIIKAFFTGGYDTDVQQCVLSFLQTVLEAIDTIEEENLLLVYMIDDINNTTYHIEAIKQLCTVIKQQQLMRILASGNLCSNVAPEQTKTLSDRFKHLKFFQTYKESDFVQTRFL